MQYVRKCCKCTGLQESIVLHCTQTSVAADSAATATAASADSATTSTTVDSAATSTTVDSAATSTTVDSAATSTTVDSAATSTTATTTKNVNLFSSCLTKNLYINIPFFIFLFFYFSVRLFSVLRGHSVFSSPPQRPMTSDFEGFSNPDFIHYIYFSYLNS